MPARVVRYCCVTCKAEYDTRPQAAACESQGPHEYKSPMRKLAAHVPEIDRWWHRLYRESPLTGKETVQLQNFLYTLKTYLKS